MVKKRNQYGYLFILFTLNPKRGEQNTEYVLYDHLYNYFLYYFIFQIFYEYFVLILESM